MIDLCWTCLTLRNPSVRLGTPNHNLSNQTCFVKNENTPADVFLTTQAVRVYSSWNGIMSLSISCCTSPMLFKYTAIFQLISSKQWLTISLISISFWVESARAIAIWACFGVLPLIAVIISYDFTLDNYASPSCLKEITIAYARCLFQTADCWTSVNEVVQ